MNRYILKSAKLFSFLLASLLIVHAAHAQRFKNEVFRSIDSSVNVEYGKAINIKEQLESLKLDLFLPPGDTMGSRPVVIFVHGGGFQNGNRKLALAQQFCLGFAKKGYVTASISYRLGIDSAKSEKEYAEAMYRAQQDVRTAIRFLKSNAQHWGIDTQQVFLSGTSAGAMTALAVAYMDADEVPALVDTQRWGRLEGDAAHNQYSSKVHGVINMWGAMIDYRWINQGDMPLYNTSGTADKTVPFDSSFDYHGFKYGANVLYQRCLELGIPTTWRPFYGAGHTLGSQKPKLDSCFSEIADWLYTRLSLHKPANDLGVRRWEKEVLVFDSLNAVEQHGSNAILFLGSSYIRMWKNIRKDLNYSDIIHRGFGGCNLADVAYYTKRIVYPHQPKAIFMYVGNDIVAGVRDKTPLQVLELFKHVVRTIREKYPDVPITWLQISPSERRWSVWDKVSAANAMISAYCTSNPGLYYIASSEKFLTPSGQPNEALYLKDKLHYNEAGYRVWGKHIRRQVHKIAKSGL
jgi:lysophospholipase L1-like esterase/pimeloyl-ACP methyl ester carboxylesterase